MQGMVFDGRGLFFLLPGALGLARTLLAAGGRACFGALSPRTSHNVFLPSPVHQGCSVCCTLLLPCLRSALSLRRQIRTSSTN